jgi:hypothetical protein
VAVHLDLVRDPVDVLVAKEEAMKKACLLAVVVIGILSVTFSASAATNEAWIPGLASFVVPGLGQLLNDQIDKAILHFGIDVAIVALGYYGGLFLPIGWYLLPALHLGWALYSGYDAYSVAKVTGFTIGFTGSGVAFSFSY